MSHTKTAKLFQNGASQAVRLPAEFRFQTDEVYISRDAATQDVILSTRPGTHVWNDFFAFTRSTPAPKDWMKDRPMNRLGKERKPLFKESD